MPAALAITECTKLRLKKPRPSFGWMPSFDQAPQDPTSTGQVGSVTSKMRKSGRPGVRVLGLGSKSGEEISSELEMAVRTYARFPRAASQISCEPRGSRRCGQPARAGRVGDVVEAEALEAVGAARLKARHGQLASQRRQPHGLHDRLLRQLPATSARPPGSRTWRRARGPAASACRTRERRAGTVAAPVRGEVRVPLAGGRPPSCPARAPHRQASRTATAPRSEPEARARRSRGGGAGGQNDDPSRHAASI